MAKIGEIFWSIKIGNYQNNFGKNRKTRKGNFVFKTFNKQKRFGKTKQR